MSLILLAGLVLIRTFLSWSWKSTAGGHGSESHHPCHRELMLNEMRAENMVC
jgi:hypothetical protein